MPGFFIYCIETNESTCYMKKLNWILLILLLAVVPALQSCDDSDGYSIGDRGRDWATVRVQSGDVYYLEGDRWGTIWPAATSVWGFRPIDGERVIAYFNPLYDNFEGFDVAVKMENLFRILTKGVEELTAENEAGYGNDPIVVWQNDMWIGGGYLNVIFQQNRPKKEKHQVSLVRNTTIEDPNDGYIHLEYRYNTYGDVSGYWSEGAVSFNLKSLEVNENTKGIKVKLNTADEGEKELTFNLKNFGMPETVKDMNFSNIQIDKLK